VEFPAAEIEYTGGTVHQLTPNRSDRARVLRLLPHAARRVHAGRLVADQLTTHPTLTSNVKFMNFYPFNDIETISPRRCCSSPATRPIRASSAKTPTPRRRAQGAGHVVPGAGHVDLYDRVNLIPFDKLSVDPLRKKGAFALRVTKRP
jgi:hypothetical protein